MHRPEDDTDRLIREALEQEDAEAFLAVEDPTAISLFIAAFRGTQRRFAVLGTVLNALLFAGGVLGLVQLFRADDALHAARWGAVALLCFGMVVAVKIWYWLEMVRLAITRDLKRMELRMLRTEDETEAADNDPGGSGSQ